MVDSERNPYIIGTPIEAPEKLFGRERLFKTIEDSLNQDSKFILLHGQRRIGKSSVLKNIPFFVSQDEFFFVLCDLEAHGHSSLGQILYAIARAIVESLNIDSNVLNAPDARELDNNSRIFARRFLPQVYDALDNKNLVLLLDEFDVVTDKDARQASELLDFLQKLVRQQDELFIIAVVGRYLHAMPNLLQLFRNAPFQEIGLLDYESAEQLITQSVHNVLKYQEKTIKEIWKFSAGHPYYTQALCYELFNLARDEKCETVTPDCISDVIYQAIEIAEGGLGSFWDGLSIPEQVVISAVAEVQEIAIEKRQNILEDPSKLLEACGLTLTNSLEQAIKVLIEKGFLNSNPIKVKVELARLWLVKRHQLRDEIRNLERLEEEDVEPLLVIARKRWKGDNLQNALGIYEQILSGNPNHFSTIVELAEKYLQIEDFDKALNLYERAYKVDPASYKQEFVRALDTFGHWLITQKNYERAKQQYEKILKIEPDSSLAQQKLAEIKAYQSGRNNISLFGQQRIMSLPILFVILLIMSSIGGAALSVFHKFSRSCPAGQEKQLGICEPNTDINQISISRGGRTLFSAILNPNPNRDQGIDAFNKGNYQQAVNYFTKAVKSNRRDPEVLIYQNNARARQQGSPLTLAAVVAAKKQPYFAQEILRGIAQAQNEFNNKGGLNGRLLEIVIADDSNPREKVQEVATKLVKDASLLGVIGHATSTVTQEALPIYTDAKLAVVSPTSNSSDLDSKVLFRTEILDKTIATKLAEQALPLQLKNIVIIYNENDPYSKSIRKEFQKKINPHQDQDTVVDQDKDINLADTNLDLKVKVADELDKYQPEAIVLFPNIDKINVAPEIAQAYKEWMDRRQNNNSNRPQLKLLLLGGDSLYSDSILKPNGNSLEGLVLAVPWFRGAPTSKNFAQKAKEQWQGDVSWRTATSFDATQAFIKSFHSPDPFMEFFHLSPDPSRESVLQNLSNVNLPSEETSGESLKFTSERVKEGQATLIMVKDSNFVLP